MLLFAKSRANGHGRPTGGRRPCALASSPSEDAEGHRWFSSEKFTKVRNGNLPRNSSVPLRHNQTPRHPEAPNGSPKSCQAPFRAEGVKYLWGYPAARCLLHLRRALQAGHHPARAGAPRAGGHARADGYARHRRRRRRAGHLGRASTNAVTGIATAYMDSIPMVIITGQVPTRHRPGRLPGMRHRRHHAPGGQAQLPGQGRARSGDDDQEGLPSPAPAAPVRWWSTSRRTSRSKTPAAGPSDGRDALVQPGAKGPWRADPQSAAVAAGAKRPYIYTGGGVLLGNASESARRWSTCLGCPVTNTLMGLGAIRATDRFLGMLGMHGTWKPTTRCRTATCCWPSARVSTTA